MTVPLQMLNHVDDPKQVQEYADALSRVAAD